MPSRVPETELHIEKEDKLLQPAAKDAVTYSAKNGDGVTTRFVGEENSVGALETLAERKVRKRSHYVVYITTFIMSIGFSIILPGLWPYLQQLDPSVSKEFLGWVVAAHPLGQMLASPLMGIWANRARSNRIAFLTSVLVFLIGNVLYATLSLFGYAALAIMIFSRFMIGVSSANVAIIRSYVAASTTISERTTAVSLISAAQGVGYIFGPAIQSALAAAFSHGESSGNSKIIANSTLAESSETIITEMPSLWDMYTAAGWLSALFGLLILFLYIPSIYKERPIAAKEVRFQKRLASDVDIGHLKPDYLMLIVLLITFFCILTVYVLIETLLVPMTMDMYAWSDEQAIMVVGIGLSIIGVMTVVLFVSIGFLSKKFDERTVLLCFGLIPMTLSCIVFFPMSNNYPKIQNCTVHSEMTNRDSPSLSNSADIMTTLIPYLSTDNGKLINDFVENRINNSNEGILPLLSSNGTSTGILDEFMNHHTSESPSLLRRRRHISVERSCFDLGCPPVQTWCFNTPIIEKAQLAIASLIAMMGFPIGFGIISALFSKILGPKPQGFWMGILTSIGSLSRVVGPIFVSYVYTALGTRWTFGILFLVLGGTTALTSFYYKRLVPMKIAEIDIAD